MKRTMRLGTIAATIVGGIVAVAWIVKDRLTGPAPAPAPALPGEAPSRDSGEAPPLDPAPARKPAPARTPQGDDDLSEINGIGPVYKTKLAEAGITAFADLANAEATEIAAAIEAPVSRVQAWIDAARRRSA